MHFRIFTENYLIFIEAGQFQKNKMLVQTNHFTLLQSALQGLKRCDKNIVFHCSDGKITCISTYFKVHSKFLRGILSEIPTGPQEFIIHLPDIPKSHMSHLVSLMSQGSSNFSSSKLSNVDSLSDVINDVLDTADFLGVQISNYGFDLAEEGVENLNNIKEEPSEYCEIECVSIKSECNNGKTDNNVERDDTSPAEPIVQLETFDIDSMAFIETPSVEKDAHDHCSHQSGKPTSQLDPKTREQQRREAFLERAKFKSLMSDQQQNQSNSEIMQDENITNSLVGEQLDYEKITNSL